MKRMITSVSRKAGLPLPDFNKGRTPMKRNIARRTLLILSIATLCMTMAATARAGGSCSLALATGNWAFSNSGTVIGVGPRVAEGILTLDAAGKVRNGKFSQSLNGIITRGTFTGAYTVNSDCTGALSFDVFDQSGTELFTGTADIAFDDNMRQFRHIFTSAALPDGTPLATAIVGDARKLFPDQGDEQ
jgi:hypothetical protein